MRTFTLTLTLTHSLTHTHTHAHKRVRKVVEALAVGANFAREGIALNKAVPGMYRSQAILHLV